MELHSKNDPITRPARFQPIPYNLQSAPTRLTPYEKAMVEMAMDVAKLVGIKVTVAAIWGVVYASARPLSMDEISERLGMGISATQNGLLNLQRLNLVRELHRADCRKNRYAPEDSCKTVLFKLLQKQIFPKCQVSPDLIASLRDHVLSVENPKAQSVLRKRLKPLEIWSSIPFRNI